MTKHRTEADPKLADVPGETCFIAESDEDLFPPTARLFPHYYARDLYEVRRGESLREAMDRASRESVAATAAEAEAAKQR